MTVSEYLKEMEFSFDMGGKFQLYDVVDKRGIYCKGYSTLKEELSKDGYEHVRNAKFISHLFEDECNVIIYIKEIENYSNFELIQLAMKLYNKRDVF